MRRGKRDRTASLPLTAAARTTACTRAKSSTSIRSFSTIAGAVISSSFGFALQHVVQVLHIARVTNGGGNPFHTKLLAKAGALVAARGIVVENDRNILNAAEAIEPKITETQHTWDTNSRKPHLQCTKCVDTTFA